MSERYNSGTKGGVKDIRNTDNLVKALNDPDFDTLAVDGVVVTSTPAELNIMDGVGATAAEINAAADVSAHYIVVANADYTILVANSGKPHVVANVSADRTFTLPTVASGLVYEFTGVVAAADGHDWIFDTGSDTNYFTGGVVFLDQDATSDEISGIGSDLDSNSKLQINLPDVGTHVKFICDGTLWNVSGVVHSATAPAFADQ